MIVLRSPFQFSLACLVSSLILETRQGNQGKKGSDNHKFSFTNGYLLVSWLSLVYTFLYHLGKEQGKTGQDKEIKPLVKEVFSLARDLFIFTLRSRSKD